jgi:hypothetical protein
MNRFYGELRFTLDEACGYPLPDLDRTNRGQPVTVRDRVEDTVKELRWQCDDATQALGRPVEPALIVLAGGGCRLPLIAEVMRRHFPPQPGEPDRLVFKKEIAKQRVAHGMASYLALRQTNPRMVEGLSRSVHVLHHHIGLRYGRWEWGRITFEFTPVARVGTALDDPGTPHPFTFDWSQVGEDAPAPAGAGGGPGPASLALYVQDWRRGPRRFGYFDLSRAAPGGEAGCLAAPLPLVEGTVYQGDLRLSKVCEKDVPVQRIEVRVTFDGQCYGPYPLITTVSDLESVLHG